MICCQSSPCTRRIGLHGCMCFVTLASIVFLYFLYLSLENPGMIYQGVISSVERRVPALLRNQFGNDLSRQILGNEIRHQPIIREDLSSFLSPLSIESRMSFPINVPKACEEHNVSTLMSVHSAVTNFRRRGEMRKSLLGQYALTKTNNATLVFFLGIPSESVSSNLTEIQRQVEKESEEYGDIVQINIEDTYRNLVQKAIGALHWITHHCSRSKFVLKMDDDITLNKNFSIATLERYKRAHPDFIVGEKRVHRAPHRSKKSKYFVPLEQYPFSKWPPFVSGGLMAYPTSTAAMLLRQATKTKPVWLEDVFITGICAQQLGIPVLHDNEFVYNHEVDSPND